MVGNDTGKGLSTGWSAVGVGKTISCSGAAGGSAANRVVPQKRTLITRQWRLFVRQRDRPAPRECDGQKAHRNHCLRPCWRCIRASELSSVALMSRPFQADFSKKEATQPASLPSPHRRPQACRFRRLGSASQAFPAPNKPRSPQKTPGNLSLTPRLALLGSRLVFSAGISVRTQL